MNGMAWEDKTFVTKQREALWQEVIYTGNDGFHLLILLQNVVQCDKKKNESKKKNALLKPKDTTMNNQKTKSEKKLVDKGRAH